MNRIARIWALNLTGMLPFPTITAVSSQTLPPACCMNYLPSHREWRTISQTGILCYKHQLTEKDLSFGDVDFFFCCGMLGVALLTNAASKCLCCLQQNWEHRGEKCGRKPRKRRHFQCPILQSWVALGVPSAFEGIHRASLTSKQMKRQEQLFHNAVDFWMQL